MIKVDRTKLVYVFLIIFMIVVVTQCIEGSHIAAENPTNWNQYIEEITEIFRAIIEYEVIILTVLIANELRRTTA